MAVAVVASSCQKDLGGSPDSPVVPGAVPADFDWKTTRNVTVSVSAPVVEGATPPYAVIRIYSSPILSAENLAARGVAKSAMPFRSAFTLPAGTENLYVQTTLPDGTKSVKMVGAHGTVAVTGASMKAAAAPKMRLAANARVGSSMPDYPKMEAPDAASFDSKAVITAIESGKSYQLGASWAFYAAPEYLIPAGAEVAGKLDLNGGFSPYQAPILYVAGKLTLSSLNIGRAKLAVLPGGEVKIGTLKIQPSAADGAAVYVFADGKLSVGKPNVSGKCIVNNGTLTVDGSLDMNSGLTVYNTATGVLTVTDEMKVSNSARIYNDGAVTVDDLKINSDGEFHNCENALLVVNDECELERNTGFDRRDDRPRYDLGELPHFGERAGGPGGGVQFQRECRTRCRKGRIQQYERVDGPRRDLHDGGVQRRRKGRQEQFYVYRRRRSKGRGPDFGEGVYPQRA